ncbi:MAG: AMP-binding protein, partial [Acidobacteriota bacterium]
MTLDRTVVEFPREECLPRLIEAQAARAPEDIAVICGDARISYRELNGRANRMARKLVSLGVGPDVPVGICVQRSVD